MCMTSRHYGHLCRDTRRYFMDVFCSFLLSFYSPHLTSPHPTDLTHSTTTPKLSILHR
jgi:hypothetical protein